jgi:hypothetical protein
MPLYDEDELYNGNKKKNGVDQYTISYDDWVKNGYSTGVNSNGKGSITRITNVPVVAAPSNDPKFNNDYWDRTNWETYTPKKTTNTSSGSGGGATADPYAGYRSTLDDLYNKVMGYGSYTPGTYSAKYDTKPLEGQLAGWLNEIDNYGEFKYDLNADMLYKQMVDNSVQKGQLAAQDVMANAAALSGGYGNSYAAALGNQAYQQFLTDVNNNIPQLQQQALNVWQAGLDQLYGQLDAGSQQLNNLLALEAQNFAQWQANEANAFNAWNAGYQQVLDQYNLGVNHIGNIAAYQPVTYSGGSSSAKAGDDVYYRNAYGDALKNAAAQMAATPGNPYTQDQLYEALKQQNAYNNEQRYLEQKKNRDKK